MPKPFVLTGVEALRNGHTVTGQRLRRKIIFPFPEVSVHQSSDAAVLPGAERHWVRSLDRRAQKIRAGVISSTLKTTSRSQHFLLAGPLWKVFIFSVSSAQFSLLSLCSLFLLPSQNRCSVF